MIRICFFYALSLEAQKLENRLNAKLEESFSPVYYLAAFNYPAMPVVSNREPESLQMMNWGLVPPWTQPENVEKMRSFTLNARGETLFTKPSFREAAAKRRCLVPATGFYEWREWRGKKYPYFIYTRGEEIFNFAGLWEEWFAPGTNEVLRTFSIITKEANPFMAQIHNVKKRMPVILKPENEKDWLRAELSEEEVCTLTEPLAETMMLAHPISKLITSQNQERNVPEIQIRYHYPGLPEI